MPFLDHLEELRWRIAYALGAVILGVVVAFVIITQFDVLLALQEPIRPYLQGRRLVYTSPGDGFRIAMSASLTLGIILALPVVLYQTWAFLSPALYTHEKRVVIPLLIAATALFLAGAALSFFVVLPLTLRFLVGFGDSAFDPMITASGYFGFAVSMCLAFGAVFEMPILVIALTAFGIVTPRTLVKVRRHALVLCLVVSAFITPGADPTSLLAMAIPLYLLYEVSVALSVLVHRRREARLAGDGVGTIGQATA